jgi:O-Antigen ligase
VRYGRVDTAAPIGRTSRVTTKELAAQAPPESRTATGRKTAFEAAAAWLLGFAPTVYLALTAGGYDLVARSEVGIFLWWVVLLGALVGILPRRPWRPRAWVAVGLLTGFFAWTWIATGWSQSEEQTLAETARLATYLGVLVLGLSLMTRVGTRAMIFGLAAAIALVSGLAVLSRLVPSWFPTDSTANLYATTRLRYPFDYSDGVGEFAALGLPLLFYAATGARTIGGRALAAAALPIVVLCLGMTISRGGILAAAIGLIFFFALVPDRLPKLLTAGIVAATSAVEMAALVHRAALHDTVGIAPAGERHSMLVVAVLAAVGAGLIQAGVALAGRHVSRPRWLRFSRRGARGTGYILATAVVIGIAILIATGTAHHLWNEFKQPNPPKSTNTYSRLLSVAGSHRYQYWQIAIDAFKTSKLRGIGPGTFQFYWSQHQTLGESVHNAHSLWIETLAEAGIVGLLLIGGFFAFALVAGSIRAMRMPLELRLAIGTAVAGIAGFCAAAAFDWVWQIGVMPLIALLLVAVALGPVHHAQRVSHARRRRMTSMIALAVGALFALWAIIVPLSSTIAVRSSESAARAGHFRAALSDAATAQRLEPGAASPRLQRALVLEQLGDVKGAGQAIREAEAREPTNWQIWLVASRIATEAGNPKLALAYYNRSRSLNPTSPIFRQ